MPKELNLRVKKGTMDYNTRIIDTIQLSKANQNMWSLKVQESPT